MFGDERTAYERRLPERVQDIVADLLVGHPVASRQFLRDRLYARIEADATLRSEATEALVETLKGLLDAVVTHAPRLSTTVRS